MLEIIQKYWLEFILTGVSGGIVWAVKRLYRDNRAVKLGVQALLRDRIIQAYNYYMDKKYCPIYGRENVAKMYEQYHNLGGNGAVTHIVEELDALPTNPPEEDHGS